jgi:hypothetical protein
MGIELDWHALNRYSQKKIPFRGVDMNRKAYLVFLVLAASTLLFHGGCMHSDSSEDDIYIIRVGETVMTLTDFNQILKTAEFGYSYTDEDGTEDQGRDSYYLSILNQATEELLLREHARILGLQVTETELEEAINDVKADYPDGVFEQVLLESAVSYKVWRTQMLNRLLMDKVIADQLETRMEITPEEIAAYYTDHYQSQRIPPDILENTSQDSASEAPLDPEEEKRINEKIIKHLRRDKAEKAYESWIGKLSQRYPVDINWEEWRKLVQP